MSPEQKGKVTSLFEMHEERLGGIAAGRIG